MIRRRRRQSLRRSQSRQSAFQIRAFGRRRLKRKRFSIGIPGLRRATGRSQHAGARGMEIEITVQRTGKRLYQLQCGGLTSCLGDRDSPVQRDYRRRLQRFQRFIERRDLAQPIAASSKPRNASRLWRPESDTRPGTRASALSRSAPCPRQWPRGPTATGLDRRAERVRYRHQCAHACGSAVKAKIRNTASTIIIISSMSKPATHR